VVQIQKFSAFLKVYTKIENPVGLIPVAAYAHVSPKRSLKKILYLFYLV